MLYLYHFVGGGGQKWSFSIVEALYSGHIYKSQIFIYILYFIFFLVVGRYRR